MSLHRVLLSISKYIYIGLLGNRDALVNESVLCERKKQDKVLVPEKPKTSRKKNSENEFNVYAEIGRGLATLAKDLRDIITNFMRQLSEPAEKVKDEVGSLKSSLKGKQDGPDNLIRGLAQMVKDVRSVVFRVLHSLTASADGMEKTFTKHLEKSVPTDQHLKDVSEHVGYEDMSSDDERSDSYSFFYEDTTPSVSNKTKTGVDKFLVDHEEDVMAERQSSSTNAEVANSEKYYSILTTKANQLTHSKYHHKLRKPNFKTGEVESVKRTRGRFEKHVNERGRNKDVELNYDSKGQPLHIKKALTLFARRNTSHEVTWPLVKKPIKMSKRRRRLLGGRPHSLRTSSSPKPNKAYKISLRQRKAKRKTKLTSDDCVDTNMYPTTHSLVNVHSRPVKHSTKQKRKHEMFEENASRIDFNKLLDSEEVKEDSVELSENTKKDLLKSSLPAS